MPTSPAVDATTHQSVIFLHAPRTAGSTLHAIIERQYPPETIYTRELLDEASRREFQHPPYQRGGGLGRELRSRGLM